MDSTISSSESSPLILVPARRKSGVKRLLRTLAWVIVGLALLLVLAFTNTSYGFAVEGDAMLPTLHNGDKLQVNTVIYRLQKPQRGDIVVFTSPLESRPFLKRVLAVEGETIEIKGDRDPASFPQQECGDCGVYINGILLHEKYVKQTPDYDYGPTTIESGMVFVMGDNRRNSSDSHIFGPLEISAIWGKAIFQYYPDISLLINPPY